MIVKLTAVLVGVPLLLIIWGAPVVLLMAAVKHIWNWL
jgi:hypothetical protein